MTAIKQTKFSNGQRSVPVAKQAGEEMTVVVDYSFVSGEYNGNTAAAALTAATDRIEAFILPAFHAITDMILIGVAGSVLTVDVGLLDGTAGDAVSTTREITASLYFDDASVNAATTRMTLAAGFVIPAVDYDRGVGIVYSGDQALGAGRYVRLIAKYANVIL